MHKIVYNSDFGGFSLSVEAIFLYYKKKEIKVYLYKYYPEKGQYIGINEKDANKISEFYAHFSNKNLGNTVSAIPEENYIYYHDIPRHDKDLVAVIEELGERANGTCANLDIMEIDSNLYRIEDYDGFESIITPDANDWIQIEE